MESRSHIASMSPVITKVSRGEAVNSIVESRVLGKQFWKSSDSSGSRKEDDIWRMKLSIMVDLNLRQILGTRCFDLENSI